MLIPVIEKFHSSKTPWEVYQAVYPASRCSFFLDSIHYEPPDQTFSYIGTHPFLEVLLENDRLQIKGEINKVFPPSDLLKVLRSLFQTYQPLSRIKSAFFSGGAAGYFGYEIAALFDKVKFRKKPGPQVPELFLGFYRDIVVFDHRKKMYFLVTHVSAKQRLSKQELRKCAEPVLAGLKNFFGGRSKAYDTSFELQKFRPDMSQPRFEKMVRQAKNYIAAGNIYQANLSQRFSFHFKGSSIALYGALRKINPSPFASFLKIGDLEIVSSSPERLIRKHGTLCETKPIAGTRPRARSRQSEKILERELRSNEKEKAEHIMLVDLERNDLGRVCQWPTVKVTKRMKIEKYSHVMHLVSTIVGKIRKGKDAFDLIQAMFPGGTITGCPKVHCMEIIDELEPVSRGVYTGSLGYIDFRGDLDLNIVIRTLVLQKTRGYLQVGAGIVHDSNPAKEYEETLHKGEALVEALVGAGRP